MKETLRAKFLTFLEKDVRIRDAAQREQYVDFAETKLPEFIRQYLDVNYEGLPSVAYFADKCCYSTKYFGELVKTETGRTAKSIINDRLLSASRQLLDDETLSITQVSQRLGFE